MNSFTYGADGFEQDKTYEPENDISILDAEDTRKTRLTLKQINSMRLGIRGPRCTAKRRSSIHTEDVWTTCRNRRSSIIAWRK